MTPLATGVTGAMATLTLSLVVVFGYRAWTSIGHAREINAVRAAASALVGIPVVVSLVLLWRLTHVGLAVVIILATLAWTTAVIVWADRRIARVLDAWLRERGWSA